MNLNFSVNFFKVNEKDHCPMINIETTTITNKESFAYSNIFGMYKTKSTQGCGIQVNDKNLEKPLLRMCDKISQAIYDYQKELKEIEEKNDWHNPKSPYYIDGVDK